MIKCIVVDDEPSSIELLEKYIRRTPILELIRKETDPAVIAQEITSGALTVDLAFLDIQMPGCSGMDLASLIEESCGIIFTTAHRDYGAEAFDKNAIDFLVKPITYDRFVLAVNKYIAQTNAVRGKGKNPKKDSDFFINGGKKGFVVKIEIERLVYIESANHYTILHMENGQNTTIAIPLATMEKQMPPNFKRIQRSYILNFDKIIKIVGNSIFFSHYEAPIICGIEYRDMLKKYINEKMLHPRDNNP